MNILVLTPYAPWPAYGGGTMRIYQLLRGIAKSNRVTCLTFVPDEAAKVGLAAAQDPEIAGCTEVTSTGVVVPGIKARF